MASSGVRPPPGTKPDGRAAGPDGLTWAPGRDGRLLGAEPLNDDGGACAIWLAAGAAPLG
jgi:hypothetical protein